MNRLASVYDPDGRLTEYGYDLAGNRISQKISYNDKLTIKSYSYNERQLLIKTVQDTGTQTETVNYRYDKNGNLYSKTRDRLSRQIAGNIL